MFISLDSDQEDDLCKVRTVLGYLSCALSNRNITCNCLSTRQDKTIPQCSMSCCIDLT